MPNAIQEAERFEPTFDAKSAGASVRFGDASLAFRLRGYAYDDGADTNGNHRTYRGNGKPSVQYTVDADRLKEDIVLEDRGMASGPLVFDVIAEEAAITPDGDGWTVSADSGAPWHIERPYAIDAAGSKGTVDVEIKGDKWIYTVDRDFVKSAAYPITIDPTITSLGSAAPLSRPAVRRNFKLSDGTSVVSYFASGAIKFTTAANPYSSWSSPVSVVGSALDDFAATTDGSSKLWFAYRNSARALLVTRFDLSGGAWAQAAGFPVTVESAETYAPYIGRSASGALAVSSQRFTSGSVDELHLAASTNNGSSWATETVDGLAGAIAPEASAVEFVGSDVGVIYDAGNGSLYWRKRPASGGVWNPSVNLGTVVADQFSVASTSTGLTVARTLNASRIAISTYTNAAGWSTDTLLAAVVTAGPQLTTDGTRQWLFYTTAGGTRQSSLLYRAFDGVHSYWDQTTFSWTGWSPETQWVGLPAAKTFSQVWVDATNALGSTFSDATSSAGSTTADDVEFGANNGDDLYLGLDNPFSQFRFTAGSKPSTSLSPSFAYWDGSTWVNLAVTDRTSGFTATANVSWTNPTNADGSLKWQRTWRHQGSDLYYLRIRRTASVAVWPKATQITAMPYVLAPSAAERDAGLLPVTWVQANPDDSAYDVQFDAIDVGPPAAALVSPTAGSTCNGIAGRICGDITMSATASDNYSGVKSVDFWAADAASGVWRKLGTDTSAPFSLDWRTLSFANGPVDLAVTATDNRDNASDPNSAARTRVTINNVDNLGRHPYDSTWTTTIGDRLKLGVNRYNGNLIAAFDAGQADAPGPEQSNEWTYNSRDRAAGAFGSGWAYSALSSLTVKADSSVDVRRGDGALDHYAKTGGVFVHPAGVYDTLVQNADTTYILTTTDGFASTYTSAGTLTSIVDRDGRTASYATSGGVTTITYPATRTTTVNAAAGPVTSVVLAGTEGTTTTTLTTTATPGTGANAGRLVGLTDGTGGTWSFAYDQYGHLTAITDARGKTWTMTYAANGLYDWVSEVRSPAGNVASFDYGTTNNPDQRSMSNGVDVDLLTFGNVGAFAAESSHTNGEGAVTDYQRDADNNATQVTQHMCIPVPTPPATCPTPDIVTHATFDSRGNQLTAVDGLGKTTTYTFNALNEALSVADPLGDTRTYTYDSRGHMLTSVSARGNATGGTPANFTTTYTYATTAPYNRLTKVDPPHDGLAASSRTTSWDPVADYDSAGRIIRQTAPATSSPTQTHITYTAYDGLGRVLATRDARSASATDATYATTYTRDALGRERFKSLPPTSGQTHTTETVYDADGNIAATRDARTTGPNDHTFETTYRYDDAGRQVERDLPATSGQTHNTATTYDAAGRAWRATDARGKTTTTTYDHAGRVKSVQDPNGHTTTSYHDAAGRLVERDLPVTTTTTPAQTHKMYYGYDAASNQIRELDARSGGPTDPTYATTSAYDDAGQLVRREEPLPGTSPRAGSSCSSGTSCTTYAYDADGNQTTQIDPRGNVSGATASDYTTTTTYNALGDIVAEAVPSEGTTTHGYDAIDRETSSTNALNRSTSYTYDAVGNTIAVIDPNNNQRTYTFDAANRQIESVDPRGYGAGANPNDYKTIDTYDAVDNLVTVTAPTTQSGMSYGTLTSVTYFGYDALSRKIWMNDPRSASAADTYYRTRYAYDEDSNVTSITTPDHIVAFQYDDAGNRISQTTRNVNAYLDTPLQTTYGFDEADRLVQTQYVGSAPPAGSDQTVAVGYDPADDLTSTNDSVAGTTTATYNPTRWKLTDNGTASAAVYTAFEAAGNVAATTNTVAGNARSFVNQWRADNKIGATCTSGSCTAGPPTAGTTRVNYDAAGQAVGTVAGSGRFDKLVRDPAGRVTDRQLWRYETCSGCQPDVDWAATYDQAGGVTSVTGTPTGTTIGGDAYTYRYDKAGLLTVESYPNTSSPSGTSWAANQYDAAGNVLYRTITYSDPSIGSPQIQRAELYSYSGGSELQHFEATVGGVVMNRNDYSYDNRGNLISTVGTDPATYTWDRENRITGATRGAWAVSYTYDSLGRRARKQVRNGPVVSLYDYRWDENRLAALLDGTTGALLATYTYLPNGKPASITNPSTAEHFYYHYDQAGNVERLTTDTGALAIRYQYDARGKVLREIDGPGFNSTLAARNPYLTSGAAGAMSDEDALTHYSNGVWDSSTGRRISGQPSETSDAQADTSSEETCSSDGSNPDAGFAYDPEGCVNAGLPPDPFNYECNHKGDFKNGNGDEIEATPGWYTGGDCKYDMARLDVTGSANAGPREVPRLWYRTSIAHDKCDPSQDRKNDRDKANDFYHSRLEFIKMTNANNQVTGTVSGPGGWHEYSCVMEKTITRYPKLVLTETTNLMFAFREESHNPRHPAFIDYFGITVHVAPPPAGPPGLRDETSPQ